MRHVRLMALATAALPIATPAFSGPPYETDDPVPTEFKQWEIYAFATADGDRGDIDGASGLDLNFGAAQDLQLTATLPISFNRSSEAGWHGGRGDVELGAKYRFFNNEKSGWQAAIFPRVILPTGTHAGGSPRARFLLPAWVQKDLGRTSIFGGGGYEINPGNGNRNFWQAGLAVTHDMSETLSVGTELTWQSADTVDGKSTLSANLGLTQKLSGPFSLLLAFGPTRSNGQIGYHSYGAISLNF